MPEPTGTGAEERPSSWKAVAAKHRLRAEEAESEALALQERLEGLQARYDRRREEHAKTAERLEEVERERDGFMRRIFGPPRGLQTSVRELRAERDSLADNQLTPEEAVVLLNLLRCADGDGPPWSRHSRSLRAKLTHLSKEENK